MGTYEDDVKFTLRYLSNKPSDWWFPTVLTPRKAANSDVNEMYLKFLSRSQLEQLKGVYKTDYNLFYS